MYQIKQSPLPLNLISKKVKKKFENICRPSQNPLCHNYVRFTFYSIQQDPLNQSLPSIGENVVIIKYGLKTCPNQC